MGQEWFYVSVLCALYSSIPQDVGNGIIPTINEGKKL